MQKVAKKQIRHYETEAAVTMFLSQFVINSPLIEK